MKFELEFTATYAHAMDKVWHALTDRAALARWLMDNDLDLGKGRQFRMWCDDGEGHVDTYSCEVLEIERPHRLVWSWVRENRQGEGSMTIEFTLVAVPEGTRLTVRHSGDLDPSAVEAFKGGWPEKLRCIEKVLSPAK